MTGYKAYQGNQVEGAGPLGLVLLTYDVLYKSLGRARFACEGGDIGMEANQTGIALEALIELSSSLNMEAGGDIAVDLARLYAYMIRRLSDEMCSGSTQALTEVMSLVQTLREGWQQLDQSAAAQSSTAAQVASEAPVAPRMAIAGGLSSPAMAYGL